ncbi:MAG: dehydrogenase, partial [Planctomycetes bacterium]|nr:dehydrogenase [Planctomycetota bacterium]
MQHASSPTHAAPPIASFGRDLLLRLYERMVLLRRFELCAQVLNRAGKLPGFLHLYIGEEATAVGVCAHLATSDWITSTHRGHGHALAKGLDPTTLLAEIGGKASGCCGGRGGSMHLYDPPTG